MTSLEDWWTKITPFQDAEVPRISTIPRSTLLTILSATTGGYGRLADRPSWSQAGMQREVSSSGSTRSCFSRSESQRIPQAKSSMPSEQSTSDDDSGKESRKFGEENREYWRYFSDRANELKDNLWTQVTWLLGLVGALIAFVVDQEIVSWSGDGMLLVKAWPALLLGFVGIGLCLFGTVLIFDAGDHIKRNWLRQDYFSEKILINALVEEKKIRGEKTTDSQQNNKAKGNSLFHKFQNLPAFCQKLLAIVAGFMLLFAACVIVAVARLAT
jgi:hypothetical protein